MTPEGKVKKECRAWLRAAGCFIFSPTQMGYGKQGVDDFVCWRGNFIAIEYKREDGPAEPTERQGRCLTEVYEAGGDAWCVNSLTMLKHKFFERYNWAAPA